jgi:hypothetical protein
VRLESVNPAQVVQNVPSSDERHGDWHARIAPAKQCQASERTHEVNVDNVNANPVELLRHPRHIWDRRPGRGLSVDTGPHPVAGPAEPQHFITFGKVV